MREIKFRAWINDYALMADVNFLNIDYKEIVVMIDENDYEFGCGEYELMQYTGLKDKNGKEIYEGDILLFNNSYNDMNRKWKCVVKYREGSFVCEYPVDGVYNHFDVWNVPKVTWEIIGNIYENPELLEGEE